MGVGRKFRTKAKARPKKQGCERNRRVKVHKKRLIARGLPEAEVARMTAKDARLALKKRVRPAV